MTFASRVAKNTFILISTHSLTYSISIVVFALLARHLKEVGLGRFNYVSSVLSLFLLFSGLGLDIMLVREIARYRERTREYVEAALSLKLFLSIVVGIGFFFYILFFEKETDVRWSLFLAVLAMGFSSWSLTLQGVFNAHERMSYRGLTLLALNMIQLIGVIIGVLWNSQLVFMILVYHVFGSATGMLVAAYYVRKVFTPFRPRFAPEYWKELFWPSLTLFPPVFAGRIYFLVDIVLLRWLCGDQVTGWFSAAKKLLEALHMFSSSLTHALFPALAHHFKHEPEKRVQSFQQMSKLVLLMGLPMGVFLIFCARGVIDLIYGLVNYTPSVPLLRAMGGVTILLVYDTFVQYFVIVLHLERSLQRVAWGRIVLTLGVTYLLVHFLESYGAILALALINFYDMSLCLYLIRRELGPLGILKTWIKPLCVSLCYAGLLYPIRNWNIFILTPVAGIEYALLLVLFGELGKRQLEQMGIWKSNKKY